ncbi:uncharacterized protein LOC141909805 [Tubulanus polymorphus]|uniref:uncharacterized protein LOC141909805 n=1 Tax=Tubulanus polymorphus TaxID=672921 RepID=UPI003DA1F84F
MMTYTIFFAVFLLGISCTQCAVMQLRPGMCAEMFADRSEFNEATRQFERYNRTSCTTCYCDEDKSGGECHSCGQVAYMQPPCEALQWSKEGCYLVDPYVVRETQSECCSHQKVCSTGKYSKYFDRQRFELIKTQAAKFCRKNGN